jgi:hypothetical protein
LQACGANDTRQLQAQATYARLKWFRQPLRHSSTVLRAVNQPCFIDADNAAEVFYTRIADSDAPGVLPKGKITR